MCKKDAVSALGKKGEVSQDVLNAEFRKLADPLMEYLRLNFHPHVSVIVEGDRAELSECLISTFHREPDCEDELEKKQE